MANPYHDATGRFASGPKISGTRGMKNAVAINKKIKAVAQAEKAIAVTSSHAQTLHKLRASKGKETTARQYRAVGGQIISKSTKASNARKSAANAIGRVYQPRITKSRKSATAQLRTMNGATIRLDKAVHAGKKLNGTKIRSTRAGKGRGKNRK